MDRRGFFGCLGRMLMVGAVTVVAPEIMEPTEEEKLEAASRAWEKAFFEAVKAQNKPHFALAC